MPQRSALIDALKVMAAQLIVLHHLVLYAPMADQVAAVWPGLQDFLVDEARYAVQIFLVIGGFLAAQGLSRGVRSLPRTLLARYLRLAPMLAVALIAVLIATALLPPGRWPDWVTPWPTPGQFVAHLLLLQDALGIPSLSAGAWYVAIDFQLYALLAIGTAWLPRHVLAAVVALLTLASLGIFNRDARLEPWAPYFFTAYGLGVLAAWARRATGMAWLFGGVCAVHLLVAGLQERPRVALAALTAIALAAWASRAPQPGRGAGALGDWSDASYGVFLIHYAVIVAATALWLRLDPAGSTLLGWSMLLGCWILSLAAGAALQRWVGAPSRPSRRPAVEAAP